MKYFFYCIRAQFSLKHLYYVSKNVFSVIGLAISVLQGAEYLFPQYIIVPIVVFCKTYLVWEVLLVIVLVFYFKWKKLGYLWVCKNMELSIEIKCCDFFSQNGSKVIQFADTFETDVLNRKLVKASSLNGQFILKYYGAKVSELDSVIEKILADNKIKGTYNCKLKGKKYSYRSGTVLPISVQEQNFIITAFSRMRQNGNSSMTKVAYTDFLTSLWQKLAIINVKDEVLNVTVFGASSISGLPADFRYQDKLHEIIKSFLLASKNQRLCKKLRICMRLEDYQQFDYEDCKSLAAYFDSHLSQVENKPLRFKRGVSFNPLLNLL